MKTGSAATGRSSVPRCDDVSMGFDTCDCLGGPFTEVPPGGGTVVIDELTLAVAGQEIEAELDLVLETSAQDRN